MEKLETIFFFQMLRNTERKDIFMKNKKKRKMCYEKHHFCDLDECEKKKI